VLKYFEHWVDSDGRLHIVTEYAAGGDLIEYAHRLKTDGKFDIPTVLALMVDMAKGLEYVHSKSVWHRDIKPSNVLVNGEGRALLADFGLAKEAAETRLVARYMAGTGLYLPPELLPLAFGGVDLDHTAAADVWALGCTFHGLLLGLPLPPAGAGGRVERESVSWLPMWHAADRGASLVDNIREARHDWSRLPPDTPPDACALLSEMLAKDPTERPDAVELAARLALIAKAAARRAAPFTASSHVATATAFTASTASTLTAGSAHSHGTHGSDPGSPTPLSTSRCPPPPIAAPLPLGWVMCTDPSSGRPYYWHVTSDAVVWERPT